VTRQPGSGDVRCGRESAGDRSAASGGEGRRGLLIRLIVMVPRRRAHDKRLTSIDSIGIYRSMSIELDLAPKTKRPAGERCCEPVVYPDVERAQAQRMADVAKALGDPVRLQLVDVLRKHAGKVCVCELVPLFDISQPTLSHHLKKLREAGIVDSERQGLWAYYYVLPGALEELTAWLS
jgi:ArsR family transcriptional regulator, arsenate/arsenite/antimonite-responsive transcriptional repressor